MRRSPRHSGEGPDRAPPASTGPDRCRPPRGDPRPAPGPRAILPRPATSGPVDLPGAGPGRTRMISLGDVPGREPAAGPACPTPETASRPGRPDPSSPPGPTGGHVLMLKPKVEVR